MSLSYYPFLISFIVWSIFTSLLVFLGWGFFLNLFFSLFFFIFVLFLWGENIFSEGLAGFHSFFTQSGFKFVFILFIFREVILFFGIFWFFFDSILVPIDEIGLEWVPSGIYLVKYYRGPFLGTILLVIRGIFLVIRFLFFKINFSFYLFFYWFIEIIGFFFIQIQLYEYLFSSFTFRDRVLGSIFFFITGFHGFHVIVGLFFLIKTHYNIINFYFSSIHCLTFEFRIYYWHLVDFVWIFLFFFLYFWGGTLGIYYINYILLLIKRIFLWNLYFK